MRSYFAPVVALFLLLLWIAPRPAIGQTPAPNDYSRVQDVPREELDAWLKEEVKQSGGDWDHQRYRLILAFSTGHFGQDPVHAIAMRRLAFSLLNNALAVGDQVTPVAWEMQVWNIGKSVPLTADPTSRAAFVNEVPYSPRQGSVGGHDVERACYDIITQDIPADQAKQTIVLLLTNSNQSQGPSGQRVVLFGQDNPKLVAALHDDGFRTPPVRKSFVLKADSRPVPVDVTALFPQHIEPLPNAPTTARYPTFARDTWQPKEDMPPSAEPLPNPAAGGSTSSNSDKTGAGGAVTPPGPSPGGFPWLWVVLGLIALALIAFFLLRQGGSKPKPKQETQKSPEPVGKPIPGAIQITVGYGAGPQTLKPLTTLSRWKLVREANQMVLQPYPLESGAGGRTSPASGNGGSPLPASGAGGPTPPAEPNNGAAPPALLRFEPDRTLAIEAATGAQFLDITGSAPQSSDHHRLRMKPGERVLCKLATTDSNEPVRLEIAYKKEG